MMEKAGAGSVKSLQELHKRTLEIIECERKKEEERLKLGLFTFRPGVRTDTVHRIAFCALPCLQRFRVRIGSTWKKQKYSASRVLLLLTPEGNSSEGCSLRQLKSS